MKQCTTCKEWKLFSEFNKNKTKPDGYQYHCRKCERLYKKQYYLANKEKHIAGVKKRKEVTKRIVDEIKKNSSCQKCGENHPACLEFHHTNPNGKDDTISVLRSSGSKEKLIRELDKCIILCANCHRKLHADMVSTVAYSPSKA